MICVFLIDDSFVNAEYSDRVFVVITQINKFGTMLSAWAEAKSDGGKLYQVSTLMGKRDDPLLNIYARQIIERMAVSTDKPLLLSISLHPDGRSAAIFQSVLNRLFEINTWQ